MADYCSSLRLWIKPYALEKFQVHQAIAACLLSISITMNTWTPLSADSVSLRNQIQFQILLMTFKVTNVTCCDGPSPNLSKKSGRQETLNASLDSFITNMLFVIFIKKQLHNIYCETIRKVVVVPITWNVFIFTNTREWKNANHLVTGEELKERIVQLPYCEKFIYLSVLSFKRLVSGTQPHACMYSQG